MKVARSENRLDLVHLIRFGDGRKAHDLARLLGENMTNGVVLVEPLHDNDNGAVPFVIVCIGTEAGTPPRIGLNSLIHRRRFCFGWGPPASVQIHSQRAS
jgi:hypothetical protein